MPLLGAARLSSELDGQVRHQMWRRSLTIQARFKRTARHNQRGGQPAAHEPRTARVVLRVHAPCATENCPDENTDRLFAEHRHASVAGASRIPGRLCRFALLKFVFQPLKDSTPTLEPVES